MAEMKRVHKHALGGQLMCGINTGPVLCVSTHLICYGLLMSAPPVTLGRQLSRRAELLIGPVPVLRPLSGASIICTQLSPQPVPGADRRRPITDQPGFGSGQSVEASHASIPTPPPPTTHPQSLPPSCLILVLSLGNRSLSSRPTH